MASVGFRWLDILEKEFDKAFVDLDLAIGELDSEEPDVVFNVRQKLCTLSSCFAQLTHKAQTIFQNSAKIEAELIHMRTELVESKAKRELLEQELHNLLLQLHSSQLQQLPNIINNRKQINDVKPDATNIKKKLDAELRQSPVHLNRSQKEIDELKFCQNLLNSTQYNVEKSQLQMENASLRNSILALNSEVYGAKLAAKYLDKELAGRIQQLQLLGREMRGNVRDKLWRQLESEILLQRHKTVVRACRRNSMLNNNNMNNNSTKACPKPPPPPPSPPPPPPPPATSSSSSSSLSQLPTQTIITTTKSTDSTNNFETTTINNGTEYFGDIRTVVVKRKPNQGLGISITGGREHGVPILISELEPNGPASLTEQLYIGDAILYVNDRDLRQACHREAVDILQQQNGDCTLQVQYIAADDSDTSLEDDGYSFRFFDGEVCETPNLNMKTSHNLDRMNTPTAPRTPESDSIASRMLSTNSPEIMEEMQKLILEETNNMYDYNLNKANGNLPSINNIDNNNQHSNTTKDLNCNNNIIIPSTKPTTTTLLNYDCDNIDTTNLVLIDNATNNIIKLGEFKKIGILDENLNCSITSLNSENLSSPMQTSTDICMDSELLSTDAASNDSQSPKNITGTSENVAEGFNYAKQQVYASNDSLSNPKSDQSLLNSAESCGSSPVHKMNRDYKKLQRKHKKKYFGVKTLQSIFSKHDGYSDISSTASEVGEELKERPSVAEALPRCSSVFADTTPQFEENVHNILSDMFAKSFPNTNAPPPPPATASRSGGGPKKYFSLHGQNLRVGKALRLCPNEDAAEENELRKEKLLARYVYNANSINADGVGDPDFGTPV